MSALPVQDRRTNPQPAPPGAHLDEWVRPDLCDEGGLLRAAKVLEWMDVVGVLCASRYAQRPVVTAGVDGVDVGPPVTVGSRVSMTATVVFTSARSMGVAVHMEAVTPSGRCRPRSMVGFMTFVALDDTGRAGSVSPLVPETPTQRAWWAEGQARKLFFDGIAAGARPPDAGEAVTPPAVQRALQELHRWTPSNWSLPWAPPVRRHPHQSAVHKVEPVMSANLNFHKTLYGGQVLGWAESAAAMSARAYLGGAPVTWVGLHGLQFLRPVPEGVFVHLDAVVAHTSFRRVTVAVNAWADDPLRGTREPTLRGFISYGTTPFVPVPPMHCSSAQQRLLLEEVSWRLLLHSNVSAGRSHVP